MQKRLLPIGHTAAAILMLLAGAAYAEDRFAAPYPDSDVAIGVTLDWSTHRRFAQGSDNFQLTWADDGHLYGAWGDGGGFGGSNRDGRVGIGVARIEGPPHDYRGTNVWGGKDPENPATFDGKSWGMICSAGTFYMWVTPDRISKESGYRNHYEYVELARSTDRGATWTKAEWKFLSSENLTIPTFLNFGKDNRGVPSRFGDYIYSYFIRPESREIEQEGPNGRGLIVHKPGAIYLARVLGGDLFADKRQYEFYRGTGPEGDPRWGTLDEKTPVFEDANGVGWCMSASYNPYLQRVVLCTEHGASSSGLLGMFDAPHPWGPWTTIAYCQPAVPFGAVRDGSELPWNNNVFFAAFATKWLDGDSFTLNFTGAGRGLDNDSFNTVRGTFRRNPMTQP